jgi:predicted amidohydrolase YtcJ
MPGADFRAAGGTPAGGAGEFLVRSDALFTMDQTVQARPGAVVVRDGMIAAVLPRDAPGPAGLPALDAGARAVLPGFVDPHVHLEMMATAMYGAVDCHTPPCASVDDVLTALSGQADLRHARGGWLVGQGGLFAARRFAEQRLPTRHDLDKVSADFPIALRFGAHVTIVNTRGLRALPCGLRLTGDQQVCLDASGEPTGELHELFYQLPVPPLTGSEMRQALGETARRHLTRHGVTTIGEITNTPPGMRAMACLAGSAALPMAVHAFAWAPGTVPFSEVFSPRLRERFPATADYTVRGVKLFVDGGFSARGAAVLRPYRGSESLGRIAFGQAELTDLVRRADASDLQVAAHVNGERAQRLLCDAAVSARSGAGGAGRGVLPVRLEHAGNVLTSRRTMDWWARAGAVPVVTAGFVWSLGTFIPESAGDYTRPGLFPFRELIDQGWQVASCSDCAASEFAQANPMFGVQCAVARRSFWAMRSPPGRP